MNLKEIHSVYFLGIGGIGMSALARYFQSVGAAVSGYDRTRTPLCEELAQSGMEITYNDSPSSLPEAFRSQPNENKLVVYTPAIPHEHPQLKHFEAIGFRVIKRSIALGLVTASYRTIAVAGTHGKTTTSAMLAHILVESGKGCNAFLGGISTNYQTNFVGNVNSDIAVVEADEFDRSFHTLTPEMAIITSVDADHLDIYNHQDALSEAFAGFASQVKANGLLIVNKDCPEMPAQCKTIAYGISDSTAIRGENIYVHEGAFYFDYVSESASMSALRLGLPGRHNVENALAATGIALALEVNPDDIRKALSGFKGVKRRFEVHINTPELVYVDDYAHHPTELTACIDAARELFPGKRITGVFQPHLYSRTRDFAEEFGRALSALDEVLLMEIYPAREAPIEGVSSEMLLPLIQAPARVFRTADAVLKAMENFKEGVILTLGAGDIDQIVEPVKRVLKT
jgi:UDP-N-acetylmuramate--alanine ligase